MGIYVMSNRSQRWDCFWDFYIWCCRIFGIATAIGLWGIGVETAVRGYTLGTYLLVAAFIMSFLETIFVVQFWASMCDRNEQRPWCNQCWKVLSWIDHWKKGLLYLLLAIGCFVQPQQSHLPFISGVMVFICSILYFIKTYKARQDEQDEKERTKNQTFEAFEEVPDELEDNTGLGTLNTQPIFRPETLADQDEILEV